VGAEIRVSRVYDGPSPGDGTRVLVDRPGPREALARLRALAAERRVTPLTATKDLRISQAAVLADILGGATS